MDDVERIRRKFEALRFVMDERLTRLWAAAEAESLGHGGKASVMSATGIRPKRIAEGIRDLAELRSSPPKQAPRDQRVRRPGAGRPPLKDKDATLLRDLEALVDPATRGDPESPLRWTCKSKAKLATELQAQGHKVSATMVGRLLHELGYSLQATSKRIEGSQSPHRDAQFKHINSQAANFIARGQPVVSVDTKKKELVGSFRNAGREWQPKGKPVGVKVHDFIDDHGKVVPYGVYDPARNEAWVSVGIDHDTAAFAVAALTQWWNSMGRKAYPKATELLITADAGGSNSARSHSWKLELQRFATATGLQVHVSHFPPGTSKWNKIEHRLFSHITQNWRGRPLESRETVVKLIANTKTTTGLRVKAKLDRRRYPTGIKVPARVMRQLEVHRQDFLGAWNYALHPASAPIETVL